MSHRQGDIVLVPVPFTDLSSHKRRPVVSRFGTVSDGMLACIRETLGNAISSRAVDAPD